MAFRPPKPWALKELGETITTFANWQSNIKYHLSLNNDFAPFIEPTFTWRKASTPNRGLTPDAAAADAGGKTAAQKNALLEHMLGIVAQFSPSLIRNDIINRSTSLEWIWQRIRQHFGFRQSEVTFLGIYKIKRTEGERYETLYQRLVAHVEDNLLKAGGNVVHDGVAVAQNEEISPSCERLLVYLWLVLIDERLPAYICRVYAHDLQTRSLKDVQPQICQAMDSLLAELNAQEDIQVNRSFPRSQNQPFTPRRSPTQQPQQQRFNSSNNQSSNPPSKTKSCVLCRAAGRAHNGHDLTSCWFISKFERMQLSRALQVSVEDTDDDVYAGAMHETAEEGDILTVSSVNPSDSTTSVARRVATHASPVINTFYKHYTCKIVIDSGATSSMVSLHFVKRVGLTIRPTSQGARQMDKSLVDVRGEVKFYVSFGPLRLIVEALVTDTLDCDVLAGVPFGKSNSVMVDFENEIIFIRGHQFPWGATSEAPVHQIRQSNSVVLRNDRSTVVYPGEYVEIRNDSLSDYEGQVSIEPRADSPLQGRWPLPMISRVIRGTVRIPNADVI